MKVKSVNIQYAKTDTQGLICFGFPLPNEKEALQSSMRAIQEETEKEVIRFARCTTKEIVYCAYSFKQEAVAWVTINPDNEVTPTTPGYENTIESDLAKVRSNELEP